MNFEVKGSFSAKKMRQPFTKVVEAKNESHARHKVESLFGSKHGLMRRQIRIESVAQAKEEKKE